MQWLFYLIFWTIGYKNFKLDIIFVYLDVNCLCLSGDIKRQELYIVTGYETAVNEKPKKQLR